MDDIFKNLNHLKIPLDGPYTQSFEYDDFFESQLFFRTYGFVIYRNIFTSKECEITRNVMWDVVESLNDGLERNNSDTWHNLKSAGKYGLSTRGPCFHPVIVNNRQNTKLIKVLKNIIQNDILVSHDRFTIYRATDITGGDKYQTGMKNLHLDLNPWWWCKSDPVIVSGVDTLQYENSHDFIRENNLVVESMGPTVQCVLNFEDNLDEDGGTILVPTFHKYFKQWTNEREHLFQPTPWYDISGNKNDNTANELLSLGQRIPMRAGSVLIWDQTMAHGSAPNKSKRCRFAQFLRAFPKHEISISSSRLERRSNSLKKCLEESDALNIVTPEGETIFGFN